MDTTNLAMQPFTLAFKSAEVEGEFLGEVAQKRWPVLMFIFCFDVLCFLFRFTAKLSSATGSPGGGFRGFCAEIKGNSKGEGACLSWVAAVAAVGADERHWRMLRLPSKWRSARTRLD
jgi:hypothetical protein